MSSSTVRQALLERRLTLGTWIQIAHPAVAEILAEAGFDWIAAEMEHTDIDNAAFANLARAMHGRGVAPLARVRENDTLAIRQVLDLGAQGVIVPLVHTAEDAERAVAAAKYPPRGVRGYCFSRMNDWGKEFDAYAAQANDDIAVVVMIESKQGVENIDAILAVVAHKLAFIEELIVQYDLDGFELDFMRHCKFFRDDGPAPAERLRIQAPEDLGASRWRAVFNGVELIETPDRSEPYDNPYSPLLGTPAQHRAWIVPADLCRDGMNAIEVTLVTGDKPVPVVFLDVAMPVEAGGAR